MADFSPSTKVRRAQSERSESMRRRLLDAAVFVLKDRGLASFRTAEVISKAGVSKGALLYHFPTKDDLIAAAFKWLSAGTDRSAQFFRPRDTLDEVVTDLLAENRAFFFGDSFFVSLDITISTARTPELRDTIFNSVRGIRQRIEALWAEQLSSYGVSHERAIGAVTMVAAVFRGSAVRSVWELDRSLLESVERATAEMVLDYLRKPLVSADTTIS